MRRRETGPGAPSRDRGPWARRLRRGRPAAASPEPTPLPAQGNTAAQPQLTPTAPATAPRAADALPHGYRVAGEYAWRFLAVAAALAVLLYLVALLRVVVLPVVVALLLSALLQPVVVRLRMLGLPRVAAAVAVFVGGLGLIGLFGYFLTRQITGGLGEVNAQVAAGVEDFQRWLERSPLHISAADIESARRSLVEAITKNRGVLASRALGTAAVAAEVLTGAALTLFTLFFFLYDGQRIWRWLVRLLPRPSEAGADIAGERAWVALVGYVRATALVALVDGVFIGVALLVIGVPLAVPLGALVFIGAFVPVVGAVVTGLAAVLVALATKGVVAALLALAAIVAVQQIEGHLLQPLIVGRLVRLHPLAVVLAVAAGAILGGIAGAVVAVPIVAVVNAMVGYYVRDETVPPPAV